MGEQGSVSWQFNRVAYFAFPCEGNDFDKVFEIALEGGADDVTNDEETIEIFGAVENFKTISDLLLDAGINPEESELRMIPNQEIELPLDQTIQVLKVLEALEELDDVANVFSNLKISDEAMEAME